MTGRLATSLVAVVCAATAACNAIVTTSDYRFDRPPGAGAGAGAGSGGASGSGGGGAGNPCDDFERANDPDVGNGWLEKTPAAFSVLGGELVNDPTGPAGWKDNVAYWGEDEAYSLHASVVVRFTEDITGHPRLLVRAPILFIDGADAIKTYAVGIPDADSVSLIRQDANTVAGGFDLTSPVEVDERYRISVDIAGQATAVLDVTVEHESQPGMWTVIGEDSWTDTNSPGFLDPGTAGVAMNGGGTAVFDDFCLTLND
jgi:hypothetical protein